MQLRFQLEYWKDGSWFVGRLPQVPGVFSQGGTLGELEDNIRDAYRMMLEEQESTAGGVLGRNERRQAAATISITIQYNPATKRSAPVPRHTEIPDTLCKLIERQLAIGDSS